MREIVTRYPIVSHSGGLLEGERQGQATTRAARRSGVPNRANKKAPATAVRGYSVYFLFPF